MRIEKFCFGLGISTFLDLRIPSLILTPNTYGKTHNISRRLAICWKTKLEMLPQLRLVQMNNESVSQSVILYYDTMLVAIVFTIHTWIRRGTPGESHQLDAGQLLPRNGSETSALLGRRKPHGQRFWLKDDSLVTFLFRPRESSGSSDMLHYVQYCYYGSWAKSMLLGLSRVARSHPHDLGRMQVYSLRMFLLVSHEPFHTTIKEKFCIPIDSVSNW